MTTATATLKDKFRQVYADAVEGGYTDTEAYENRQLHWHGPKVSLAEAAEAYALIYEGYNNFQPDALAKLLEEFPDAGIEVTPAREGSPAVYLHIPAGSTLVTLTDRVKAFVAENLKADEIDIVTKFSCLQEGETELVGEALRVWWD